MIKQTRKSIFSSMVINENILLIQWQCFVAAICWMQFNCCFVALKRGLAHVLYSHIKFFFLIVYVFGSCFKTLSVILVSDVSNRLWLEWLFLCRWAWREQWADWVLYVLIRVSTACFCAGERGESCGPIWYCLYFYIYCMFLCRWACSEWWADWVLSVLTHVSAACFCAGECGESGGLIGYCLYFYIYSTWEGRSCYMEDLYVTPTWRGNGIGTSLWVEVTKVSSLCISSTAIYYYYYY